MGGPWACSAMGALQSDRSHIECAQQVLLNVNANGWDFIGVGPHPNSRSRSACLVSPSSRQPRNSSAPPGPGPYFNARYHEVWHGCGQRSHPGCQYLNFAPFHESICSSTSKGKQALFDNNDCPPAAFLHGQIGNDLPSRSQN